MEVHHHSHSSRKKWTHYLWEFMMLFLAVFCGFLAENAREHYVEHEREKQYIRSMIADLKTDTANLSYLERRFKIKEAMLDSLIRNFEEGTEEFNRTWAGQFLLSYRSGFPDFYPTDRTIQQLKNAGGLRLIRKEAAAAGIIAYDAATKDVLTEEAVVSLMLDRYIVEVMKVWSVRRMYQDANVSSYSLHPTIRPQDNYWYNTTPVAREQLFNALAEYNEAIIRQGLEYQRLKERAVKLMGLLREEYGV